jgi:hypothetical protein
LGRREKKGFSSEIPNFIFGQEGKNVSVLKYQISFLGRMEKKFQF